MNTGFIWSGFGGTATQTICLYPYSLNTIRSTHECEPQWPWSMAIFVTLETKISSKMRRPEDIATDMPMSRTHMYNRHVKNIMGSIPSHAVPNNGHPHPHRQVDKNYAGWGGQIDSANIGVIPGSLSLAPQDHWERIKWRPAQQSGKHQTSQLALSVWTPKTKPSNKSPKEELSEMVTHRDQHVLRDLFRMGRGSTETDSKLICVHLFQHLKRGGEDN